MRLCLMIEGQEGVTWDQWVALAGATEASGLEGLFRSDHYSSFDPAGAAAHDAWATISALAALTRTIRLGTLVSPATFRHPSVVARMVATADHVSGGRVELGLGAGWFEREHDENGFPFGSVGERFELFAEHVELVVRHWTEERFDHHGTHYRLRGARSLPRPLQRPHPPLILGGNVFGWTADQAYAEMKKYRFEGFPGHPELKQFVYDTYAQTRNSGGGGSKGK